MITGDQIPGRKPNGGLAIVFSILGVILLVVGFRIGEFAVIVFGLFALVSFMKAWSYAIEGTKREKLVYVDPEAEQDKSYDVIRGGTAFAAGYIAGKKTGMDQE